MFAIGEIDTFTVYSQLPRSKLEVTGQEPITTFSDGVLIVEHDGGEESLALFPQEVCVQLLVKCSHCCFLSTKVVADADSIAKRGKT